MSIDLLTKLAAKRSSQKRKFINSFLIGACFLNVFQMIHFANISNQENVWLLSIKTDYMLTKLLGNSWLFFGAVILFFLSACTSLRPADSSIPKPRKPRSNTSRNISSLRTDIIRTARKYKGSKYKYGGTTPKGFDCSGFTSYVLLKNYLRDIDKIKITLFIQLLRTYLVTENSQQND